MKLSRSIYYHKPVKVNEIIRYNNKYYKAIHSSEKFSKGAVCQGYYVRIILV